jgi:adenylate cyclase
MTAFRLFRLKNALLFSNFVSNVIGVFVVILLTQKIGFIHSPEALKLASHIRVIFSPLAFSFAILITLIYETPIRRYLSCLYQKRSMPPDLTLMARRRLLNEPFFMIILDLVVWIFAAVVYAVLFSMYGIDEDVVRRTVVTSVYTGVTTATVAFFVLEFVLQRRLIPCLFPEGNLTRTPGTLRIRIRTRLVALLLATNLIPCMSFMQMVFSVTAPAQEPVVLLQHLRVVVPVQVFVFVITGIWLTFLVSSNLTRPLQGMIRVLAKVRKGFFDEKVLVTSNDEIGYTGDIINEMTEGLKERDFIKETFGKYVTKEIRDEILSGKIPLDGESRIVTVLFADLRGFTQLVESEPPQRVVKIINQYFEEMEEAIGSHHGLVVQFIGDEIEAVFGAPKFHRDHPRMAMEAALDMRKRLSRLNNRFAEEGLKPLAHGIGIHTGDVIAANIGSPDRLSYALVGDTVNLASRLQDLSKQFDTDIIVSETTKNALGKDVALKQLPLSSVKGKTKPVQAYAVL